MHSGFARRGGRQQRVIWRWVVGWACLVGSSLIFATGQFGLVQAQGFFLLTEDTQPIPVVLFPVSAAGSGPSVVTVEFGFATQEAPTAGQLHDSVTLSLGGFLDGNDRVLATLDVFGLTLNPRFDAVSDFADGTIAAVPRIPDSRLPVFGGHREAVELSFQIPSDWSGHGDLAGFLASNGDTALSVAYIRQPVFVPEPGMAVLTVAGGLAMGLCRRRRGGLTP